MAKTDTFHYWKRRFGDRYDGWRVRHVDPVFSLIPFFLRTRLDSQVHYEERMPVDVIERFIREYREDIPGLSIMQVMIAACLRVFSQRPKMNRFVIHNKIYARNYFSMALTVKRSLTDDGEETVIKVPFELTDTLYDVVRRIQAELDSTVTRAVDNGADVTSKWLGALPSWVLRPLIGVLRLSDRWGCLPAPFHRVSPWHTSLFVTNMGSLGVESVYHHLYEFGTCSMFASLGRKSYSYIPDADGNMVKHKSIMLRFVIDERICDGLYYASSMRLLAQIFNNPEVLLTPPAKVVIDDGVKGKKGSLFPENGTE